MDTTIESISALEILDSRDIPAVEGERLYLIALARLKMRRLQIWQ